jgi:glycosyltransferase involved in cell wall biosynthesis
MLSIIVPVYNEKESLDAFYREVTKEMQKLDEPFELIFVDDGSTDISLSLLKEIEKKDKRVSVYSFRKNQGKAEALTLGFQKAQGERIVTLDADLQDKPSEIKKLLHKQKEDSVDIVSGWRKDRKDASKMVIISHVFNAVAGWLFDVHLHDFNCGLKVYTADAAKSLRLYGGMHRFIPLLASQQGFTVDEVVVEHEKRKFGESKYKFSKIKDIPDMFTMLFLTRYSKKPLHFFGPIGGFMFSFGAIIFAYLCVLWFMGESIGRRPLLLFSVLLLLGGLQIFFTGFLAELITSTSQKNTTNFPLKYASHKES